MAARAALVAFLALAVVTAGCLGGGSDPGADPGAGTGDGGSSGPGGPDDGDDEPQGLQAPRWSPGLWWRYNVTRGDGTGSVVFAVQAESQDRYTLLANGTSHAARDALEDLAYVGPVRVEDFAGVTDEGPVRFFEWPLEDGKTWTTPWNGVERTHEATRTQVTIPGGTLPGVEVTSTADGRTLATYEYAPAVGWFTRLELPQRNLTYTLADAGFAYRGNLTRAEASTALEFTSPAARAATFDVPAEAAAVVLRLAGGGERVSYDVSLADPNGTRHAYGPEACMGCSVDVLDLLPAVAGTWTTEGKLASTPTGNLTASASVVTAETVTVDYGGG